MKGYRTIIVGLLMAVAPAGLTYLGGVDWTHIVGPNAALIIAGLVTMGMRLITTTPVGEPAPPARFLGAAVAAFLIGAGLIAGAPASAADLAVKATPAPASAYSWAGLYVEGYALYGANLSHLDGAAIEGVTLGDLASSPHGPGIGGAVGWSFETAGGLVWGPRLELAYANLSGGGSLAQQLSFSNATNYLGSADLVVGLPLSADRRLLGYIAGGFAFGGAKPNLAAIGLAPTQVAAAANDTSVGWNAGGGLAYAFDRNWSVFIEGDFYKLGDKSLTASFQGVPIATATAKYDVFVQKLGLNYRF